VAAVGRKDGAPQTPWRSAITLTVLILAKYSITASSRTCRLRCSLFGARGGRIAKARAPAPRRLAPPRRSTVVTDDTAPKTTSANASIALPPPRPVDAISAASRSAAGRSRVAPALATGRGAGVTSGVPARVRVRLRPHLARGGATVGGGRPQRIPMAPHPELIVAVAAENHLVTHGTVSRK
jgi:hypothetical protein